MILRKAGRSFQVSSVLEKYWRRYLLTYVKTIPVLIILVLLNCRIILGKLIFTWNLISWYLLLCYLIFPLTTRLVGNWASQHRQSDQSPKSNIAAVPSRLYAAGLPLLPFQDYAAGETHILPRLVGSLLVFLLAPFILFVAMLF